MLAIELLRIPLAFVKEGYRDRSSTSKFGNSFTMGPSDLAAASLEQGSGLT